MWLLLIVLSVISAVVPPPPSSSLRYNRPNADPNWMAVFWGFEFGVFPMPHGLDKIRRLKMACFCLFRTQGEALNVYRYVESKGQLRVVVPGQVQCVLSPSPPLTCIPRDQWWLLSGHPPSRGFTVIFRGLKTDVFCSWYVCCIVLMLV